MRKLAKGSLLFSPFVFLSLFLFLFPGQGLKIYQAEKQDGRVQPFPDKFTDFFSFCYHIVRTFFVLEGFKILVAWGSIDLFLIGLVG